MLIRAGCDPKMQWSQLTKQQVSKLAHELTAARFEVSGRGQYRDEFVTCGGVSLQDVDCRTFSSKASVTTSAGGESSSLPLKDRLFLCGEVLDIDGVTGGFNFQSAWTTGFGAGRACAESLIGSAT